MSDSSSNENAYTRWRVPNAVIDAGKIEIFKYFDSAIFAIHYVSLDKKKGGKRGNGRGGVRYWLIWKQHWWRIHRLWGERNEFNNPFFVCSSMPFQYLQSLCVSATMRTWKARILSYLEYEFSASFKVDWKKNDSANVPQHTKIDLSPITVFFPSQYFSANVF